MLIFDRETNVYYQHNTAQHLPSARFKIIDNRGKVKFGHRT